MLSDRTCSISRLFPEVGIMGNFESQLEGLISWALSFYRPNHSSYGISIAPILFIKICQIFFPPFNITITLKCTKGCNLYRDQRMFIHDVTIFSAFLSREGLFFPLGTMIMHILFIFLTCGSRKRIVSLICIHLLIIQIMERTVSVM